VNTSNSEAKMDQYLTVETVRKCEKSLREAAFISGFRAMQQDAAAINKKNGFNTDDPLFDAFEKAARHQMTSDNLDKFSSVFSAFRNARVGLKLMLAVGELGEALEAVRKNLGPDSHCPEFTSEECEVADAIIRLMNYASDRKLRLAEAVVAKNEFNRNHQDHSKESRAAEHGKKF
jgi:NTP pyrophosphatase (non-canonical NTP hydrolase)